MTTQQQLERTLDLSKSSDARRVLLNRLAYETIREMERKIKKQREATGERQ
mgnify:CR=1 FL=1